MSVGRPFLVAAALALGLPGCGEPSRPAVLPAPPSTPGARSAEDPSRAAVSARLRAALDRDELEAAHAALLELRRDHEGVGELPDGRTLPPVALIGALLDSAVSGARSAVSGMAPDRARAAQALRLAESLAPDVPDDEAAHSLVAARRWVALDTLGVLSTPLAPNDGPRIVLAADDFDLGEPDLVRTLSRWAREGASAGLRVGVVPLYRGYVRVGNRRSRAQHRDEERAALAARLASTGIELEPEPADAQAASADFGLRGQDLALLAADRSGRVVARLSGRALPLAPLESLVQRLGSR